MTTIDELLADRRRRLDRWAGWRSRVGQVRALVAGQWATVFPNDVSDVDLPMIANLFRVTTEDVGRQFAEQIPQERVDKANERDGTRAETREKALVAFGNRSRFWDRRAYFGMDLIAAGLTGIRVWPNMRAPLDRRFPMFERLEPEMILPEPRWRPDRPTDHVIVTSTETATHLARQFPDEINTLMSDVEEYRSTRKVYYARNGQLGRKAESDPDELEIIDYYCRDKGDDIIRAAVWCDDDEDRRFGRILMAYPNPIDSCSVQLCARKTWTAEPMGQLDDAKGPERTRNRYFRLLIDYFVKMVYGGRLAWNVQNPHDTGSGTVYLALGPDAKMEYVTPDQPGFEVNAILASLEDASRTSMISPRSREGDVELNKATAAFLQRAQGQRSSVVADLQDSFARTKRDANEVAAAWDEYACNARKEITGIARGRRFAVSYTPSETWRNDYANRVTYGLAAGLDAPTLAVINLQKQQVGNLTREAALEMDPTVEDVPSMLQGLRLQRLEDSIFDGLLLPTTPLEVRVKMALAIAHGASVEDLAEMFMAQQPAAPAAPAAPGPGGAPGFGPPGVAAEGPLPPMSMLQGQPPPALPAGRR